MNLFIKKDKNTIKHW